MRQSQLKKRRIKLRNCIYKVEKMVCLYHINWVKVFCFVVGVERSRPFYIASLGMQHFEDLLKIYKEIKRWCYENQGMS